MHNAKKSEETGVIQLKITLQHPKIETFEELFFDGNSIEINKIGPEKRNLKMHFVRIYYEIYIF